MKNKIFKFFLLFFSFLYIVGLFSVVSASNKKVVGYFIEWGIYGRNYLVKDIPANKLTHVNFAFAAPFYIKGDTAVTLNSNIATSNYLKSDGSNPSQPMYVVAVSTYSEDGKIVSVGLTVDDVWACFQITTFARKYNSSPSYNGTGSVVYDVWNNATSPRSAGIFGEFKAMKTAYPSIKILASIGGWSYSYYFVDIASTTSSRNAFAKACKQFLDLFPTEFDGVDLDWEFPITGGDSQVRHTVNDGNNFVSLCQAIRTEIGSSKALTIASSQNYQNISNQYKIGLKDYVDFISIMAYDYAGAWSSKTGMNAPLYGSGNTNDPLYQSGDSKYLVINEAVQSFLSIGIPSNQLVIGLPFYGRSCTGVTNANNGLFQTFSGAGIGSFETGSLEFNDLVDGKESHDYLDWDGSNLVAKSGSGYTKYWDNNEKVPYLFNGSTFISYDDTQSISTKVNYALSQGLGGVMIWELSSDLRYDSATSPNLLVNTIYNVLNSTGIKGYIKDSDGYAIVGATVTLSGTMSSTTTTNSSGYYEFFGLTGGVVNYTVTPTKTNYNFTPVTKSTTSLTGVETFPDFIGASILNKYSISGTIVDTNTIALANITVNLTGDITKSTTTNSSGNYTFTNLLESGTYTITPSSNIYSFAPISISTVNLIGNLTSKNFTGTLLLYYIKGYVQDENNNGISGATVTLSGSASSTTFTNSSGYYEFVNLLKAGNYTITPSVIGDTFTPVNRVFSNLSQNYDNQNFSIQNGIKISGYVRDSLNNPLSGLTVDLSSLVDAYIAGVQTWWQSRTTNSSGYYEFVFDSGTISGDLTVTSWQGTFLPASFHLNSVSTSAAQNFYKDALPTSTTYYINGYLRDGLSNAIIGATVTLSGTASSTTFTNSSGYYEFLNLVENSSCAITPSKLHYTFSPVTYTTNTLTGNISNKNFTATRDTFTISGQVRTASLIGITKTIVTLSTGTVVASTQTDSGGNYSFPNIILGGENYNITVSSTGYYFSPTSISTNNVSGNISNANFTGALLTGATYYIKGYVKDSSSNPITGVTISLSGTISSTTVTNSSGYYEFSNLIEYSSCAITLTKTNYKFSPVSFSTNALNSNLYKNFTGILIQGKISGYIKDNGGVGLEGVTVTIKENDNSNNSSGKRVSSSGTAGLICITDAKGYYEFSGMDFGKTYILSLYKAGYVFSPDTKIVFVEEGFDPSIVFYVAYVLISNEIKIYPNPCYMNKDEYVRIDIPDDENKTEISIYNILGERLKVLKDGDGIEQGFGKRIGKWYGKNENGQKVASGIYIFVVKYANNKKIEKIAILW
jgi:GH18 family chitinase